jgi:cullin-4
MIRSIFLYLDRTYVLQTSTLKSLWEMGLFVFRENILSSSALLRKTVDDIMDSIQSERYSQEAKFVG